MLLWWTIRALPPSLGFLRFEGITTITYSIYLFGLFVNHFGDNVVHLCVGICDFFQLWFGHHVCIFQDHQISG